MLKKVLKGKFMSTHIENQLKQAAHQLLDIQDYMHTNPLNPVYAEQEHATTEYLRKIKDDYTSYTRQRAKMNWLKLGDDNTNLFHNSIKNKRKGNTIHSIYVDGIRTTNQQAILQYFKGILCENLDSQHRINMDIINKRPILNDIHRSVLNLNFSYEEIKDAMCCIHDDKAPGLDGYNSGFFKATWDVIGKDIVKAIQNFFEIGILLEAWNVTAITLIPKIACPNDQGDFRPISYCRVIYKRISKLIFNRLKLILNDIICSSQGIFIACRSILHNVLLCQDIVKHYEWKNCSAICLLKIDM